MGLDLENESDSKVMAMDFQTKIFDSNSFKIEAEQ